MKTRGNSFRYQRRGATAVLAMLYLVLFATLALGFVGAVSTSMQIAGNELKANRATLAAESGMQFMRYQLWNLSIPGNTQPDELLDEVYLDLADQLEDTANLGEFEVGYDDEVISIPEDGGYIAVNTDGSRFRATLTMDGQQLVVKVTGSDPSTDLARAIELRYAIAQRASGIFDYGVASRSPITMVGNTSIKGKTTSAHGSVLSTTGRTPTISMIGNSSISGDITLTNETAAVSIAGNCKVAGYTPSQTQFADHVHYNSPEPEFPTIDTSAFEPYATNEISSNQSGNKTFSNIRIKANSNPTFNGNTTINGVVYIETPNRVSFSGNLTLTGAIVVENDPQGDVDDNLIDFGGNVTFKGVDQLPASYGGLRDLKYAMLLAPKFALKMRGNFGTIGGTIVASKMEFSGNAGGTIKGSVINLEDTALSLQGNSDISIESQGTGAFPAGMSFGSRFSPLPDSYEEVTP